jgi:Tol biopolymer transport system component
MIGKTLGHYRIVEKLGAGGMGVVYRAEDKTLDRQVAIKVLPDAFTGDPERLARFEREAKLLASLNHPNIAAIYGLEEAEGKRFLVLELVEGQTLAERLHKGPLPLDDTLETCRQIVEGMEAAHEKGVVHRDLKPANIKITPEGKVKILDFGLAKAYQKEGSVPDLSKSPTLTDEITRPGVILGTAAYMSPEQAKGKTVDKRADIWAFGCVLFECLAGEGAFQGETITEIVAAILKSEPDWSQLPKDTPVLVRSLLRRCLQKDPSLRLRDVGDARIEIEESLGQPTEVVSGSRRFFLGWLAAGAAVILLAGLLIDITVRKATQPAPSFPVVRAVIKLEPGQWLDGMRGRFEHPSRSAVAMSKDGRFIVYSAVKENPGPQDKPHLYLRRTDQWEAKPIAGTEGGMNPFLSPDDRWVGFWAGELWAGKLMKVAIDGGVPVPLCDAQLLFGASWASDNSIIFTHATDSGLFKVSAEGGECESLTTPDKTKDEFSHRLPHCLPDGKGVLFTVMREPFDLQPRIAWLDLKTRKWRVLMGDAADARYVPTGHLVFLRQGTLMVVPFDLARHEVTGQPVPAIANVMQTLNATGAPYNSAAGQFSISDSGWLVYTEGGILPDQQNSLVWVDHKGGAEPIASIKAPFFVPRLSPDGQRIAYITIGRESGVWVYDLNRGTASRLTGEGKANFVTWTPDGKRVAFAWCKSGLPNLYWQPADGSSAMERLATSDHYQAPGSWSPDGATLAFVEEHPDTFYDTLLLDLRSRHVTPFLNSRANERWPEFSPDGRWMAYESNESGHGEVYVRPYPGPGGNWLISQDRGIEPLWARDGKQLFYRQWDHEQVWVVDVRTDGGFSASKPRLLFKAPGLDSGSPIRGWDLSLDGQRFLMVKLEEAKPTPVTEMVLVQNWFEELKRLAPAGKR